MEKRGHCHQKGNANIRGENRCLYTAWCTVRERSGLVMVQVRNLEIQNDVDCIKRRFLLRKKEKETYMLQKCTINTQVKKEFGKGQQPYVSEGIAIRKLFPGNKITDIRNLISYAYNVRYQWGKQLQKHNVAGRDIRTSLHLVSTCY